MVHGLIHSYNLDHFDNHKGTIRSSAMKFVFSGMLKRLLYSALFLTLTCHVGGQGLKQVETSERDFNRNFGISAELLGTAPIFGFVFDYVNNKTGYEIGVGYKSVGLGFKYYPQTVQYRKFLFHSGVTMATPSRSLVLYIPLGGSLFSKGGINFGIDLGPSLLFDGLLILSNGYKVYAYPYASLRIGYRF